MHIFWPILYYDNKHWLCLFFYCLEQRNLASDKSTISYGIAKESLILMFLMLRTLSYKTRQDITTAATLSSCSPTPLDLLRGSCASRR